MKRITTPLVENKTETFLSFKLTYWATKEFNTKLKFRLLSSSRFWHGTQRSTAQWASQSQRLPLYAGPAQRLFAAASELPNNTNVAQRCLFAHASTPPTRACRDTITVCVGTASVMLLTRHGTQFSAANSLERPGGPPGSRTARWAVSCVHVGWRRSPASTSETQNII